MKLIDRIKTIYMKLFASNIDYARYLGVKIGDCCLLTTRNWSTEPYLVTIGNHVQITNNVSIHTHGGGNCIRKDHPDFDCFGKVNIEDWCYIGAYAHIMPGVTIGEGSLIAAGSIVTKSVAPHSVMAGNPARFICTTEEYYERNKKYDIKTKGLSAEFKREHLQNLPQEKFIKK